MLISRCYKHNVSRYVTRDREPFLTTTGDDASRGTARLRLLDRWSRRCLSRAAHARYVISARLELSMGAAAISDRAVAMLRYLPGRRRHFWNVRCFSPESVAIFKMLSRNTRPF